MQAVKSWIICSELSKQELETQLNPLGGTIVNSTKTNLYLVEGPYDFDQTLSRKLPEMVIFPNSKASVY